MDRQSSTCDHSIMVRGLSGPARTGSRHPSEHRSAGASAKPASAGRGGRPRLFNLRAAGQRLPPHAYFVGSAIFHYLGPAFAVELFARADPLGVAWLRIVSAAAVFAIARLPLGTVAAIEFLPVILLAALGVRTPRNGVALALAVLGVYVLTNVRLATEPLGVAFAFANAVLFALYIILAHRVSRNEALNRLDGLAAAMLIAAAAITPIGGFGAAKAILDPVAIGAGIGVGITSSVIPYVCDQLAMARLKRATYSLMVSLLPATATTIGILVLAQFPSWTELLGVGLIVSAVAVHRDY